MSQTLFEIDKQTLNDLSIFSNFDDADSVLNLFDYTTTIGGKDKLLEVFGQPLADAEQIADRIDTIQHLSNRNIAFAFNRDACDYVEFYLQQQPKPVSVSKIKAIEKEVMYFFTGDNNFYTLKRGVKTTLQLLKMLDDFVGAENFDELPKLLHGFYSTIGNTIGDADFNFIRSFFDKTKLSAVDIAKADHLFK